MSPVGVNPVCADLLLLPGLNNTGAVFDGVVAHLPASLRVHCPDLPALDRVEALADAVLADAPERFWLGGFSFGGYVAMAVLERAPERVQGIALICSTPRAARRCRQPSAAKRSRWHVPAVTRRWRARQPRRSIPRAWTDPTCSSSAGRSCTTTAPSDSSPTPRR